MISIIAAVASENRVIGNKSTLPWAIPSDLAYFKKTTLNKPVIMGMTTHRSIGRVLPGRRNIVLTSQILSVDGIELARSLDQALEMVASEPDVFIIGGAQIYRQALDQDLVDRIYLTDIDAEPEGDTYFPVIDPKAWDLVSEGAWQQLEGDQFRYRFLVLERVR